MIHLVLLLACTATVFSVDLEASGDRSVRGRASERAAPPKKATPQHQRDPVEPAVLGAALAEELKALTQAHRALLDSELFKVAHGAIDQASLAATSMVDLDGSVVERQVDLFRNHLEEMMLALKQLDFPGDRHADNASRKEKEQARKLGKALAELAERADQSPTFQLATAGRLREAAPERLAHDIPRILTRLDLLLMRRGMGPVLNPAHDASQALREGFKKARNLAGALARAEDEEGLAQAQAELDQRLARCQEQLAALADSFPALEAESMGNRAELIGRELTMLRDLLRSEEPRRRRS